MKILAISDTHQFHEQFTKEDFIGIDMIIHAGDGSNYRTLAPNANEMALFLNWYALIPVRYKIYVPGNHDTSVESGLTDLSHWEPEIICLNHSSINIEGINIFGSPFTPTFGEWSFMKKRGKLASFWKQIPRNTDILITHGPPKGILDASYNIHDELEFCGDKELLNEVLEVQPKHHIFGHIHEFKDCFNKGTRTLNGISTQFHNASCVTDRKFELGLTSKGIIINYP